MSFATVGVTEGTAAVAVVAGGVVEGAVVSEGFLSSEGGAMAGFMFAVAGDEVEGIGCVPWVVLG